MGCCENVSILILKNKKTNRIDYVEKEMKQI